MFHWMIKCGQITIKILNINNQFAKETGRFVSHNRKELAGPCPKVKYTSIVSLTWGCVYNEND